MIYIVFVFIRFDKRAFLLIVRYGDDAEEGIMSQLSKIRCKLKNKTLGTDFTEITVELKVHRNDTSFLAPLKNTPNVENVVLVEYSGDYS